MENRRLAGYLAVALSLFAGASLHAQEVGAPLPTVRAPGSIAGEVVDSAGVPMPGATVRFVSDSHFTSREGAFRFGTVTANRGWLVASYPGYHPAEVELEVPPGWNLTVRVTLVPDGSAVAAVDEADAAHEAGVSRSMLRGRVVGSSGEPLRDVQVLVSGASREAVTRADGRFALLDLPSGTFLVTFRRLGYSPVQRAVTPQDRQAVELSVEMSALAMELAPVLVQGLSGWGRTSTALADLDRRLTARPSSVSSAVVSSAVLERMRRLPLDQALMRSNAARFMQRAPSRLQLRRAVAQGRSMDRDQAEFQEMLQCILLNGERAVRAPLAMYTADNVRMVEVYTSGSDLTSTVARRMAGIEGCKRDPEQSLRHPTYYVIWMK